MFVNAQVCEYFEARNDRIFEFQIYVFVMDKIPINTEANLYMAFEWFDVNIARLLCQCSNDNIIDKMYN